MMAEKPILFNTPMVQAILDGQKTQTRRAIDKDISNQFDIDVDGSICAYIDQATGDSYKPEDIAPYQPGDILWVREAFCEVPCEHEHIPIKGGHITVPKYAYKADSEVDYTGIWKPSIHMPREAARLLLQVKSVGAERLQSMTDEDVDAEGFEHWWKCPHEHRFWVGSPYDNGFESMCWADGDCRSPIKYCDMTMPEIYGIEFWDSLYAKKGYGWDTNPWVWVITFKRVEGI